ncbi:MAG: RNA polymerase sigma factor [Pirellulales bacterium]
MAWIDFSDTSDAELLYRYVRARDARAFGEIVRRHGAMVLGTARKVLRHEQDAEDVLQATFSALAVNAAKIRNPESLAAWLHQTTIRSARNHLRSNSRWRRRNEDCCGLRAESLQARAYDDAIEILHEELGRISLKYSVVILLCDLEGLSHAEASRRLAIPLGTVKTRLDRGRRLLQRKLVSRGVTLTVTAIATQVISQTDAAELVSSSIMGRVARKAIRNKRHGHGCKGRGSNIDLSTIEASGALGPMSIAKFTAVFMSAVAIIMSSTLVSGYLPLPSFTANAEMIFNDQFESANGAWLELPPSDRGEFSILDGKMRILQASDRSDEIVYPAIAPISGDVSVRTQFRQTQEGGGYFALIVRGDAQIGGGYQAGIDTRGVLYIDRMLGGPPHTELGSAFTDLDPYRETIVMQVDAVGDRIDLYAWAVGDPKPAVANLSVIDSTFTEGLPAILLDDLGTSVVAEYDYFLVGDAPIVPEPCPAAGLLLFGTSFGLTWRRRKTLSRWVSSRPR